jgi:hypothetical protein
LGLRSIPNASNNIPNGARIRNDVRYAARLLVLLMAIMPIAACTPESRTAATVGDTVITAAALAARLETYESEFSRATLPETVTREKLRRMLLEELIDEHLMLTAARNRGLIDQADSNAKNAGRVLFQSLGREVPYPSTSEARDYFTAHRNEYHRPAYYETTHLLLAEQHRAWEIKEMLDRQAITMAEAARRFSIAAEAPAGGRLPPMSLDDFLPELSEQLARLRPGEVSPVIHTPFGYHLVRIDHYWPAGVPAFTEIENLVKDDLYCARLRDHFSAWLTTAREQAAIRYLDPPPEDQQS